MLRGGFVLMRARWICAISIGLALSWLGPQGQAWAQETDASITQMFAKAQQTKEAEGADSYAYRIELVTILEKIQTDPQRRAQTKYALRLLLENLHMEQHAASDLQVLLALGKRELDDAEFEQALRHYERAGKRITLLHAQYPNAEQRWSETKYGPEVA